VIKRLFYAKTHKKDLFVDKPDKQKESKHKMDTENISYELKQ